MKILIADDNADDRKLVRYNLERHGCEAIIEARDGREALELAKSDRPDLIISDAMMPKMDGFQFLRSIKSDEELRSIPFIFYSAVYTGNKEEELALSLGAEAFLVKPQEPDILWKTVKGVLSRRDAVDIIPLETIQIEEKEEFLKKYSEVITAKLEEKIWELEDTLEQRKNAEEALKESEARYRFLLESVTDYIYTVNVEDGLPVVTSQGPGCRAVTGFDWEEFSADPMLWFRLVYEEDRKAVPEQASMVLSGNAVPLDHRIIHKDGGIRWVRNTPVLRGNHQDQILAYDGLISDITERKELENQLHHAQKMEALGTLVGGIAHDFNNILMVIIGYLKLLKNDMDNDSHPAHYISETLIAAERAVNLTRSLLAIGRKQAIAARAVNLNEIVFGIEKMLRRLLREDIELRISLADEDLVVMGDHLQIEQVLINLAINSRDAMPSGGTINIRTASTKNELGQGKRNNYNQPGMYALIIFSDTGEGMDDQTRERIFEPFFTTKGTGKGTGLGLSVCHGIITQHNGNIECRSIPGKGTTFTIRLPMITAEAEKDQLTSQGPAQGGSEMILLAEDDRQLRLFFRELLIKHGYSVVESGDGEDAIVKFNEHKDKIALVVIDGVMPKKSGREVFTEITRINPHVKAIFTCGYDSDAFTGAEIDMGKIQVLTKPVMPDILLNYIRKALDGDRSPTE